MPRFAPPTITQAQIMAGTVLSAHIGELARDESGVIWRGVAGGPWERVGDTLSHESEYLHDYLNLDDTERAILIAALPDYHLIRLSDGSYVAADTGALLNLDG